MLLPTSADGIHPRRNWARRNTCNVCNTAKPGTVDVNREGHGGGFKELDEEEVAEARRRREEFENDDTEMCALHRPGSNCCFTCVPP